tara:strand:- start:59 stop:526 length:468 start_codon:yes stop_codon:yes gene_type:complete
MFEEEIVVSLLIAIFALCLHYYIGSIDLWYMSAVEIFIGIVFYELIKAMYKSYKTYEDHNKNQQKARQYEFNLMTDLNTNQNTYIPPLKEQEKEQKKEKENKKNITFDKSKEIRYFKDDEKLFDTVEVTNGEEEIMSDTSLSETEEIISPREKYT